MKKQLKTKILNETDSSLQDLYYTSGTLYSFLFQYLDTFLDKSSDNVGKEILKEIKSNKKHYF